MKNLLKVCLLVSFIFFLACSKKTNPESQLQVELQAVADASCEASGEGVAAAVRGGIAIYRANALVANAMTQFPDVLDHAGDGKAGGGNVFFDNVLKETGQGGITNPTWSKQGNTYTYSCSPEKTKSFVYDPKDGTFQ